MNKSRLTLAATALALTLPLLQGCFPAIVAGTAAGVMSAHDRRSTGTQADDESLEWKAGEAIPARFRNAAHVSATANQPLAPSPSSVSTAASLRPERNTLVAPGFFEP